jgi:hypothetical protein
MTDDVANAGYIAAAVGHMNMAEIQAVETVANDARRYDEMGKALAPVMVPDLAVAKRSKDEAEKAIAALEEAFVIGFHENFLHENGSHNTDPFHSMLDARKALLRAEHDRVLQQQVQQATGVSHQAEQHIHAQQQQIEALRRQLQAVQTGSLPSNATPAQVAAAAAAAPPAPPAANDDMEDL